MIELIENIVLKVKENDNEFYSSLLVQYLRITDCSKGFLITPLNNTLPYVIASAGLNEDSAENQSDFNIENFNRLFNSIINRLKRDILYSISTEDSKLLVTFNCSFKGLLVIPEKAYSGENGNYDDIESFTRIIVGLIDGHHELIRTKELLLKYKDDCSRKDKYLTGFTSEFKTPINAISGFAQLMKEPDLKQDNLHKYINIISETSEKVISRISNFNEIAELETEKIQIFRNVVNIPELLDEAYSKYYLKFKEKSIVLDKQILTGDDVSYTIVDEAKLKQIFDALISNAYENTFTGNVNICCTFKDSFYEFLVSDTGVGIDPATQAVLFDFGSGQHSSDQISKGRGLGLIIAKAYIEMMGGKIWCESTVGKGTDFFFQIPYNAVPEDYIKEHSGHNTCSSDTLKKRILVAEDDNLNFFLISSFLSRLNIDILRAENGSQAVEIFKSENIDIILMDIRMPVMDGYTASKIIREISADVKIIAQTAYSNDKSIAVSNGCNDFIAKPFSRTQLVSLVSSYL